MNFVKAQFELELMDGTKQPVWHNENIAPFDPQFIELSEFNWYNR